jgi:hypothetical protein
VKELPLRDAAKELGVFVATLYRWFPPVKVTKTVSDEDSLLDSGNGSLNQGSELLNESDQRVKPIPFALRTGPV